MTLVDQKAPLRSELQKIFKDQRTLKAFEKIFEVIPGELNANADALSQIQIIAENAATQAVLAIGLLNGLGNLAEFIALQPMQSIVNSEQDITPRYEHIYSDFISVQAQQTECLNFNLEVY